MKTHRTIAGWLILLPLLLLLTLPAVVQAQFNYTANNGTITITGYTGSGGAVIIPDNIFGLPVTSIGSGAFQYCNSLTSVTIPNSVTSIGSSAFQHCASLTSVTIPNSVTSIGDWAFYGCPSLTTITVDVLNSVYSSVAGVLFDKSKTTLIQYPEGKTGSYTITNSVTSIGDQAFSVCSSLTSVTIPNSVTNLGSHAFFFCTSLTSVTIGNSVTSIRDNAFDSCTSLTNVTIGNSVTNIGYMAFSLCSSLTSVTIPNSVTSIGYGAFAGCSLTSITIPDSVTSIGSSAFAGCTSLTAAYFKGNAPSADSSVFGGDNNAIVYYLPGKTG
jgi:BspA type Leucine rich repeat region (6 copies)